MRQNHAFAELQIIRSVNRRSEASLVNLSAKRSVAASFSAELKKASKTREASIAYTIDARETLSLFIRKLIYSWGIYICPSFTERLFISAQGYYWPRSCKAIEGMLLACDNIAAEVCCST